MHNRARRSWQAVVLVAVVGLVASIVVAAVQATGPVDVRAHTNDGGAWLIRRDKGIAGHMNRSVGEVSGTVKVAKPAAIFDVEESGEVLAALDSSSNTVSVIDPRTFQVANTVAVPNDARMIATDSGVVLWTPSPLAVWNVPWAKLADLTTLDGVTPTATGKAGGLVTANSRRHRVGGRRRRQDGHLVSAERNGGEGRRSGRSGHHGNGPDDGGRRRRPGRRRLGAR